MVTKGDEDTAVAVKIEDRTQVGAFLAQARLMFKSMRSAATLECLTRAKRAFTSESKMNKKSQV